MRNESCTENGQIKKGSQFGKYAVYFNGSTVRGFCAMYKAELEKARKEKRPIAPIPNVWEFRSNGPKVFIGSLK